MRHGMVGPRTYKSWRKMKERCNRKKSPSYKNYGGKGIGYDPRWELFTNFYADMGDCPSGFSIDRIDNTKGYSKDNCKWSDSTEQNRNTSRVKLDMDKVRNIRSARASSPDTTLKELANEYGVCIATVGNVVNNLIWKENTLLQEKRDD